VVVPGRRQVGLVVARGDFRGDMAERRKKSRKLKRGEGNPDRPIRPMERLAVYELLAQPANQQSYSAAYVAAGYKGDNKDAVKAAASRLFARPCVRREIEKLQARRAKKLDVTADRIELELARVAFSDLRDVVRITEVGVFIRPSERAELFGGDGVVEGDVQDVQLISDDAAAALAEASQTASPNGMNVRVKLHDKLKALELLMRRHGLLIDRVGNADGSNLAPGVVVYMPRAESAP